MTESRHGAHPRDARRSQHNTSRSAPTLRVRTPAHKNRPPRRRPFLVGWGRGIRTRVGRVGVNSPAAGRSPNDRKPARRSPCGRAARVADRFAIRSNLPASNPGPEKKEPPSGGSFFWLGDQDGLAPAALTLRARCARGRSLRDPLEPSSFEPRSRKKKSPLPGALFFGWGTRIRTWVGGVRVRSPTARRSPNKRIVGAALNASSTALRDVPS